MSDNIEQEITSNPAFKWYSLRVVSNKERKIQEMIELELSRLRPEEKSLIGRVLLPVKKQKKIRNQRPVYVEQIQMPGYIFVEADPQAWVKDSILPKIVDIKDVIHFLGKEKPIPMRDSEARSILQMIDSADEEEEATKETVFVVGEEVKVIEGPFQNFLGVVQEVNEEKKKIKLVIRVFGRGTEVELSFLQVEKQL
jgi:transcription termination/antitermination protein NusG